MYTNLSKKNYVFVIFIAFLIVVFLIFSKYSGNHHTDHRNIWLFLSGQLPLDIYEANSLPIRTSIFYYLFNKMGILLDNDNYGLIFHYFLSFFSLFFVYKIINKLFPEINKIDIVFIILTLSVLDNFILDTTRSGWIYHQTTSSSHVGIAIFFFFVWQTLNLNKLYLLISSSIFFLVSIKLSWFPIGVAVVYSYFKRKKFIDTIWVLPCIFIGAGYLIYFSTEPSNTSNLVLFNQIINRELEEVAIHLQPKAKILLCISLFIISIFFIRKLKENEFYLYFQVIIYLSMLTFVFGFLYAKYGVLIYPNPKILILNAVRALSYFQFIFGILYCYFVIKYFNDKLVKYLLLSLPFLLSYSYNTLFIASIILIFSLFLINIKNNFYYGIYSILLILLSISFNASINRYEKMDLFTYSKIKHWSTYTYGNEKLKEYFISLRDCEDFLLYDNLKLSSSLNFFASKSRYYMFDPQNVSLDYNLLTEHYRREKIINAVSNSDINFVETAKEENFIYATKENLNYDVYNIKKPYINLYFFYKKNETKDLLKKCPNLLK